VVLALLVFRVLWGVVGGYWSRFLTFVPSPQRLLAYLRGQGSVRDEVGHNPLGALSVLGLLGLLAAQAVTGLFGNDEISVTGPLNPLVTEELGLRLTGWHKRLAPGLFALLGLHLAAIAFHAVVKRHNLVRPMLTGWAEHPAAAAAPAPAHRAAAARRRRMMSPARTSLPGIMHCWATTLARRSPPAPWSLARPRRL